MTRRSEATKRRKPQVEFSFLFVSLCSCICWPTGYIKFKLNSFIQPYINVSLHLLVGHRDKFNTDIRSGGGLTFKPSAYADTLFGRLMSSWSCGQNGCCEKAPSFSGNLSKHQPFAPDIPFYFIFVNVHPENHSFHLSSETS